MHAKRASCRQERREGQALLPQKQVLPSTMAAPLPPEAGPGVPPPDAAYRASHSYTAMTRRSCFVVKDAWQCMHFLGCMALAQDVHME